jgi:hypothetical protein
MKLAAGRQNGLLAGDILAAILMDGDVKHDLNGLSITDAHITFLDLGNAPVSDLTLFQCIFDEVDISECKVENVKLQDCIIQRLDGVSSDKGIPSWIKGSSIEHYESVTNVARIKKANLSNEQLIFITLVKKLFFQPGAGRKEEALLRGLGDSGSKKAANRILKRLKSENIIGGFPGDEGWVYTPNRECAHRMQSIVSELTLSDDELWKELRP